MTLCVAWIRQVGDTEELIFATDSMLTGGEKWEHGIKLFELPRKDCLLCFCGSTGRAYPLILNLISSIGFDKNLTIASSNIVEMLQHISELFTTLTKEIISEVRDENIHELRSGAKFLFGGWDWQKGIFRVWELFYATETEGFVFKESTEDVSKTRYYKFIGDAQIDVVEEAKKRLKKKLYDEDKLDEKLDMEPVEILKEISLDQSIREVGGSLQIAKVYKSSRTEFFGVIWKSSKGEPHFQGRKYNSFTKPSVRYFNSDTFEIMNMDLPQKIAISDEILCCGDIEFVKSCYLNGIINNDLTEDQKIRLKTIFQEIAYTQFIDQQENSYKKTDVLDDEELEIVVIDEELKTIEEIQEL